MHAMALTIPHGTPPGHYGVTALVYDLASGQVLWCQPADDPSASECAVGAIEVARPAVPPSIDVLPIHTTLGLDVGEGLKLLGTGPIVERARPGDTLTLALFWQSLRPVDRDVQLLLRVLGANGALIAEGRYDLARLDHPTHEWVKGEVVLGYYDWTVDPAASSGKAQITLQLLDADTGQPLPGHDVDLATLQIEGGPRRFEVPGDIQHPLGADFGGLIWLLGYDLADPAVEPGGTVILTLYWQSLASMQTSYTVFAHLLDSEERIWGQVDRVPVQGTYPTTAWLPGEVVADAYEIRLSPDAPTGRYTPEIGWYDAATGQRLAVLDAQGNALGDRILLEMIEARE